MKQTAASIYLIKNNKVLFLVRNKKNDTVHKQGVYLGIGGKVEQGEGIEECIKRETLEEAGITVHSAELKGILYIAGQTVRKEDWTIFLFTSTNFTGEPQAGKEGHFEWIDMKDISKLNVYEGDKVYMQWLFEKQFFAVELHYDRFDFVKYKILKLV
jgi:8-oxo-dGTP diphosphatase